VYDVPRDKVISLIKKSKDTVTLTVCQPYYHNNVSHPSQKGQRLLILPHLDYTQISPVDRSEEGTTEIATLTGALCGGRPCEWGATLYTILHGLQH